MFLATTSDQRFWKAEEKICFLGEWCTAYEKRHIWSKLDFEMTTHPWVDRARMYKDYRYLDEVYERSLSSLTAALNEAHSKNHSLRFWRTLVGPWLSFFIGDLYEKFILLKSVEESGLVTNTWIAPDGAGDIVPRDYLHCRKLATGDVWNHRLLSRLVKSMGTIPYEIKNIPNLHNLFDEEAFSYQADYIKSTAKKLLGWYSRRLPSCWNRVVIVSSYLNPWDLAKLQLSVGQIPWLLGPKVDVHESPVNWGLREKLKLTAGKNQFEVLLGKLLPTQFPTGYLESFAEILEKSLKAFPGNPKIILSTFGPANEGFKFWSASQAERGVKIIGSQYGGGYGMHRWSWLEGHEFHIFDKYFSWGWKPEDQPKAIPLSSGKLAGIKKKIRVDPKGGILWLGLSRTRYSYMMMTVPRMPDYLKEQERFVAAISPEARRLLSMRCNPIDLGWNEVKRLADVFPSLKVYRGKKPMFFDLNRSRLCISTYNSTTYLETFAANYPTLLFWDPEQNELRSLAQPYFDDLRRSGIFHESPESAAAKVNEIYQDPLSWWMSPEVQEAKNKFCRQFAHTSEKWIGEWKGEILKASKA